MSAALFLIQLLYKPRLLEFRDQAHVDKGPRVRRSRLGVARREIVEHGFYAVGIGVGSFRKDRGIISIGALQTFWIGDAEIFLEQRLGIFLFGLDDMDRFDHRPS